MKSFNEWLGEKGIDESWFGFGKPKDQEPAQVATTADPTEGKAFCPFCNAWSAVVDDAYYPKGLWVWHCNKCNRDWDKKIIDRQEQEKEYEPGRGAPGTFLPKEGPALRECNIQTLYLSGMISEEAYYEAGQGQVAQDDSALVNRMAAGLHDDWRKGRLRSGTHGQADAVYDPRMKPSGLDDGQEIDIAQHYDKLTPKWQAENKAAAETAIRLVRQAAASGKNLQQLSSGADLEALSDGVHQAWMQRNPKADYNAAQHVPYASLPEAEKQKDRDHVLMAIRLLSGQ